MERSSRHFLNIKYEGERFSGGRLPLDILADLQALEDILTTFAREIWLEEHGRTRMPKGYTGWFSISLTGVEDGSALPTLELSVLEDKQQSLITDGTRTSLMERAEVKFAEALQAANDGLEVVLSPSQIRNFNRFLTNLKPGELFKYSPDPVDKYVSGVNVISMDVERRKRFLTSTTAFYEQRIQGRARLKGVDENGNLTFVSAEFREFAVLDQSREPTLYGTNIGAYYEFDLTVVRRHDDRITETIIIHDLSVVEHPFIADIDELAALEEGWLEGHGKAISESTREAAKKFLTVSPKLPEFYAVAPTEEGGILFEYEVNGWDYGAEFHPDGTYSVFGIELSGADEFSASYDEHELVKFVARVKETIESR